MVTEFPGVLQVNQGDFPVEVNGELKLAGMLLSKKFRDISKNWFYKAAKWISQLILM